MALLALLLIACGGDDTTTADSSTPGTGDSATTTTPTVNNPPTCGITSPEDGTFGQEGDALTVLGTVDDPDQGVGSLTVTWESDKDGWLAASTPTTAGEVALVIDDLSANGHVITLIVTDDGGEVCSDFVLYSVGEPPTARIDSPADGATVDEGETVTLEGTVSDGDTDALDLAVSWASDLDGELDTGGANSSGTVGFTTSALSPGVHTITLTTTDEDGLYGVDSRDLVVNGVPSAPAISLTPADPDTTDDLVVTLDSPSVDPDGDLVEYDYDWALFGAESSASNDARLPSDSTARGDVWSITITPNDGDSYGPATSASVTIGNAAPSLTGATITPSPASADDTLACTGTGFADPDGDSDQSTCSWSVDGTVIGTACTQTGGFGGDDTVSCELTPHDGTDAGTPVTAVTTIGNTAPSVAVVTISPDPATVADTLTCAWSGYDDPDGDADESLATWTVDGNSAGSGTTLASGFAGTESVTCTVTPFDGASTGTPVSTTITIANSVPSLTSATISPNPATADDTLLCLAAGWSDADGHSDQSTWSWTVNGTEVSSAANLSGSFTGGDLVGCTVTPDDGHDTGTPVSDSVTIDNSSPTVSDVAITPNPAVSGDTLSCTWTFTDPDSDTDESTVAWSLNGTPAGTGDTLATTLVRGDVVACSVTPFDGTDTGTTGTASLTVSNSAPSVTTVQILPASPTVASTLSCAWSGFSDADGDSDASSLVWTINGATSGTSTTLASGFTGGDSVACTVTPSDGSDTGTAVTETVAIVNTPPVLSAVQLDPSDPDADDTLTCTPGTTTDADGTTAFTYGYAWTVNGTGVTGSSDTLSGAFVRDDAVVCTVTPNDGTDDGDPVDATAVTVVNGLPEVTSVTLSPTGPDTEDTLTATAVTTDPDADTVSLSYAWTVDGVTVSGETDSTLSGSDHFDKDQDVAVTATPHDGTDDGDPLTSSSATVVNTPPYAPTVSVQPSEPAEGVDNLLCELTTESTDLDGDSITYAASWTVDGTLWTGSTLTQEHTDDTISAGSTAEGEVWECTLTPDDGDDDGDPGTDSVTISAGGCTLYPSSYDSPNGHFSYCSTQGAWMADPLETLGSGYVWSMCGYSGSNTIYEYTSLSNFSSGSYSRSFGLPYDWYGTGAVVWDGYVYYSRSGSNEVVKVDLSTGSLEASLTLPDAGHSNQCSWQWGGYSDIDFELDELGLWIVWGDYSDSCSIHLTQVDADLNEQADWEVGAGSRGSYGNAFMVDGVLYVTDSYSSSTSAINFAFDTCTETAWGPGLTFYNTWGYNSQVTYNPNDQLLYGWDDSVIYNTTVNF